MTFNYPSASQIVRNLADLQAPFEELETFGRFRIVQFAPPFFGGYEFWIVNEKGFLWEPASSVLDAYTYLESDEAKEYNAD